MNLAYYMPTKIIMDKNCITMNAREFAKLGKKAIIVTGRHSAYANGSLDDVIGALKIMDISYVLFDKVMSNPTIDLVYDGATFAKKNNCDFVVAIGGGSPMDAAKAIALLARQDIKKEDLFKGVPGTEIMPMIFVPTTAGTGSEVTQYSILTNDELETKTTVASPIMFPDVALLDGKYLGNLNKHTTISTAIDALSHAIEGFINRKANNLTNILALQSIGLIGNELNALKTYRLSKDSRNNLLFASTLAGMVIANVGTSAVHALGYSLTYFKEIDHGRANGLLLPSYLKYVSKSNQAIVSTVLDKMNLKSLDDFNDIIDSLIGDRENLSIEEIDKFSDKALEAKNINNGLTNPTKDDLVNILKDAFRKE